MIIEEDITMKGYRRKIYLILIFLYFVLKPFYLLGGTFQLADLVLTLLLLMLFFSNDFVFYKVHLHFLFFGMLFISYVFFINGIWAMILADFSYLLNTVFYIFNFSVCMMLVCLYQRFESRMLQVIYYSVVTSILIQFLISIIMNSGSYRETLFFNNPNQLGYYGLLSLAILLVLSGTIKVKKIWFYLSIIGCLILAVISLSKAAIVCSVLLITSFFLLSGKNVNIQSIPSIIFFLVLIVSSLFIVIPNDSTMFKDVPIISNAQDRVSKIGNDSDDSLSGRGYDRIWNHPEYLVLGAGEGKEDRFISQISGSEMHSTLVTILFSYGIVGFSLLIIWILYTVQVQRLSQILPLLIVFVYGLSHNGIRQTFLWILITIIFINKFEITRSGKKRNLLKENPSHTKE